jgi:hypothetical protein
MIKAIFREKQILFFGGLTGLFVLLNLITIGWTPTPWIDEVWFVETAVNYALDGSWTTTAWFSFGGETPVALYPPLYQYLLAGWIKIWGFSILSVRGFNVFIAAIISIVMFKGLRKFNLLRSWYVILIFVFLFWSTGAFSWTYRNGRPDMVNLLFSSLFIYSYWRYIKENSGRWLMLIYAVLILLSGLQACFFIVFFLFYMYLIKKEYRYKTRIAFFMAITGFIAGLIAMWGHFAYHEHPNSFFWQFSQSETISALLRKIPFLSHHIRPPEPKHGFFEELLVCYTVNKNYFILTGVNAIMLFILVVRGKYSKKPAEIYVFGFSLLMPAVMALSGHCLSPYAWMFYLPAVVFCLICMEKYRHKYVWGVYGILTVGFSVILGLPRALVTADREEQGRITEFVEKQKFDKDVVILSSHSAYYPIRKITRNSYYSAYPVQYLPSNVEYVLKDDTDGHSGEYENFSRYILKKGYKLTPVDSLMKPKTVLYKVER